MPTAAAMDATAFEEHEALIQFLYLAPAGLVQMSDDGEIGMINPFAAQLLLPLSPNGELANLYTLLESTAPDLRQVVRSYAAPSGMVCDGMRVHANVGPPGSRKTQILSLTLLKLDATRLMAMLSDVTQQVLRERLVKQQEAWLTAIMTDITDYALMSLDADGLVDDWNPSIERVTGHRAETVVGRPWTMFHPPGAMTSDRRRDLLQEADANGWSLDEGWRVRADGTRFWGSAMIAPLQSRADAADRMSTAFLASEVSGYSLVVRDVSDKREATESQRRAFFCDHLTSILNRRTFFEAGELELDRYRRSPRPIALVLIDADHFKRINDRHGHPAGDAALRHLARLAEATLRGVDLLARIGGEEFAILLPSTDMASAVAVADRFRQSVANQPVPWEGGTIPCTVSCGVAVFTDATQGIDGLLQAADRALLVAKRSGRNRVSSTDEVLATV